MRKTWLIAMIMGACLVVVVAIYLLNSTPPVQTTPPVAAQPTLSAPSAIEGTPSREQMVAQAEERFERLSRIEQQQGKAVKREHPLTIQLNPPPADATPTNMP